MAAGQKQCPLYRHQPLEKIIRRATALRGTLLRPRKPGKCDQGTAIGVVRRPHLDLDHESPSVATVFLRVPQRALLGPQALRIKEYRDGFGSLRCDSKEMAENRQSDSHQRAPSLALPHLPLSLEETVPESGRESAGRFDPKNGLRIAFPTKIPLIKKAVFSGSGEVRPTPSSGQLWDLIEAKNVRC